MRENVLIKIVYVYLTKAKHFHSLRGNSNAIKNFNEIFSLKFLIYDLSHILPSFFWYNFEITA